LFLTEPPHLNQTQVFPLGTAPLTSLKQSANLPLIVATWITQFIPGQIATIGHNYRWLWLTVIGDALAFRLLFSKSKTEKVNGAIMLIWSGLAIMLFTYGVYVLHMNLDDYYK
jgi:hypothetical protein